MKYQEEKKSKSEKSGYLAKPKEPSPEYQNLYGISCCSHREDCREEPFMKIDDDLPNRP